MIRYVAFLLLLVSASSAGRSNKKKSRHDVSLIEFIRNHSEHAQGTIDADVHGTSRLRGNEYSTRVAVNRVQHEDANANKLELARKADAAGPEEEDLRHQSLEEWKKKKKAVRLAHKEAGTKPLGARGTTLKEFRELADEVSSGGRLARVPCSPPHCTFRCLSDRQCVMHPLLKEWREPEPLICGTRKIHPISFGIPESDIVDCVPFKSTDFATVVPYKTKSYVFGPADEAEYKRDYRKALFGITRKKEGWDCMRHYEILAAGSVPMFLDIEKAPAHVMTHLPKALLSAVRHSPYFWLKGCEMRHSQGECSFGLDHSKFSMAEYESIACSLLEHTRQHLTTKALARYALAASGSLPRGQAIPSSFRALYVGGTAHNSDYLRDLMLHGFKDLLGENLFEYNSPRYMYHWSTDSPSNGAVANPNKHWGMGFSVARRLPYREDRHLKNISAAESMILAKSFDVVIYGNAHRGMPLFSTVMKAGYSKERILVLNGEDWHGWKQVEEQQADLKILDKTTYFLRELPESCPEI